MATPALDLSACELFRGVEPAALEGLRALGQATEVPSGAVLFRLGDLADQLYVVLRGRIALAMPIHVRGAEQDLTVEEKGPLEVVGWSALIPPHHATLSARALLDSALFVLPGQALQQHLASDPVVGLRVMSNLAAVVGRRLHQAQALWVRELQRTVAARYA